MSRRDEQLMQTSLQRGQGIGDFGLSQKIDLFFRKIQCGLYVDAQLHKLCGNVANGIRKRPSQ